MKITFLVPSVYLTGGIKLILEYSNKLIEKGHQVNIVFPWQINPNFGLKYSFLKFIWRFKFYYEKIIRYTPLNWFKFNGNLYKIPDFRNQFIPNADVIIASSWDTANWAASASPSKGKKFYFVQQYENWGEDRADDSYKLPLQKIVIASWLQKLMKEKFNENSFLIVNGIDINLFKPIKTKRLDKDFRIGMLYHPSLWKGTKYGIKAFKLAKKQIPNAKLVLISAYPKNKDIPFNSEFNFMVPPEKLSKIYSSCDLWVSPSLSEGCQAPPMEAMACGIPVIATNVGGVPDYTIPNKTAIVVPPKSSKAIANAIIELFQNKTKSSKIAKNGFNYITKNFSIQKAVNKLEKVLIENE